MLVFSILQPCLCPRPHVPAREWGDPDDIETEVLIQPDSTSQDPPPPTAQAQPAAAAAQSEPPTDGAANPAFDYKPTAEQLRADDDRPRPQQEGTAHQADQSQSLST